MSTAQHLRNVPIFSDLKDNDLNIIAEKMVSRSYEKGYFLRRVKERLFLLSKVELLKLRVRVMMGER